MFTAAPTAETFLNPKLLVNWSYLPPDIKFLNFDLIFTSTEKIIGCHMIGEHASEIIQMASIAIGMGATKSDFDNTMALHPTIAEEFVTMI